jgi:hypothetical protein
MKIMLLLLIGWPLLIAGLFVFGLMVYDVLHPERDKDPPRWALGGRVINYVGLSILLCCAGIGCLVIHWWKWLLLYT